MKWQQPENTEQAALSICSTLITVVEDDGPNFFSNFSLFSERISDLSPLELRCFKHLSIPHFLRCRPHHSRACLLGENVGKKRLATFPLAFYAAWHWIDHAKSGDVKTPQIQSAMQRLLEREQSQTCCTAQLGFYRIMRRTITS